MNRKEKQMELLIKQYIEGLTSLDEEQMLRDYFLKAIFQWSHIFRLYHIFVIFAVSYLK
jgi:hypothetical protein